jgi:hypothetical protein
VALVKVDSSGFFKVPFLRSGRRINAARFSVIAGGLVGALAVGGLVSPHQKTALLLVALALGAGIVVVDPTLVLVVAVPGTLLVQRLGGGGQGSSIDFSDVVLILATLIALPAVNWERARYLGAAVGWAVLYEAVLLLSVVDNPNSHGIIEWGHRLFLVAGAMVVGWVIATNGRAKQAVRLLLLGSILLALFTLEHAVTLHFQPAQWGAYQKNYIGSMMWMAVALAHLNPPWARLSVRLARVTKYLCLAALFATQSKQAIIALVVVIFVATLRLRSLRRRSKAILLALGPLVVFSYVVVVAQLKKYEHHGYNSIKERSIAYTVALHVWHLNPLLGQGPRWWYLVHFNGDIQPPNILLESLTESGVIGSIALIALIVGVVVLLARLPRQVGTIAMIFVLGRAVEGIFDLYWSSANGALPWLVAGMALGVADAARVHRPSTGWKAHLSLAPPQSDPLLLDPLPV